MKRIKLADRVLPIYTKGEEIFNMVSHIVGATMGIAMIVLGIIFSVMRNNPYGIASSIVFGVTLILLGFGILLAVFGVNMCTKIIPNLLSAISGIFRKMFSIKKKYKYQPISNNETKELTTYEKIN